MRESEKSTKDKRSWSLNFTKNFMEFVDIFVIGPCELT
jgi:hypothetical protein